MDFGNSILLTTLTQSGLPDLIYNFFLPFIFSFLILYSVIRLLRLFDNKVSVILALVITIFFANTQTFVTFTTSMSQFTGGFAIAIFFALFIFGGVQYALGRGREWRAEYGDVKGEVERLNKEIAKWEEKLRKAHNESEKDEIEETIEGLEKRRDRLLRRGHA